MASATAAFLSDLADLNGDMPVTPAPRWITVDPGEDCGLAVWEGPSLIYGETLKMHAVGLLFYHLLCPSTADEQVEFLDTYPEVENFWEQTAYWPIERVIAENWRIYPWVIYTPDGRATHALDMDECRTARLLGKIELCCSIAGVPFDTQGADIKETAVMAGAENLYYKPLHENRHQNDAIQHGVFYNVVELNRAPVDARI